jgi:1-acyl-sn-glycerol-3-phosphate acyltransferase
MSLTSTLLNGAVKGIVRTICRIDDSQLERVPERGPLIIVANHVNFLEVPILYTHLLPRPITGFVKSENWEKLATRFLFTLWGGIPIRRGEPDLVALRKGIDALKEGRILAISPEGTRSGHGILQACHPGVVLVALRSGAPILPIVYYGAENYLRDFSRLKRVDFNIAVGRPFHLRPGRERVTRVLRRQMLDEIMFRVAALLPPQYRGAYSDLEAATQKYLAFSTG